MKNPRYRVEPLLGKFPLCIVFTLKDYLTKLCPTIGHIGIVDSENNIHDFSKNYRITTDNFSDYHEPQKFIRLHLQGVDVEKYN